MRRLTARWKLSTRFVATSLAVLLLVQAAALLALQRQADAALRAVDERLERDERAWRTAFAARDGAPGADGLAAAASLAAEFRELHEVDLVLVAERDGRREVVLSTLPGIEAAALSGVPARRVRLGDEVYRARAVDLPDTGSARLDAVLLRPQQQALAPYRELQRSLFAITCGGALLLGLAGLWLSRRVAAPLAALATAARRIGRGDPAHPVDHRDRQDEVGELAQAFEQMREDIAANEAEARRLAYTDALTGLPNGARLRHALRSALLARAGVADAAREGGAHGVAVLAVGPRHCGPRDGPLGPSFDDLVLKATAERLRAHPLRDGDRLAHLGGDRFALLLVDIDRDAAMAAARRLAGHLGAPLTVDGQGIDRGAHVGLALWPTDAADADTLLTRAEVALRAARRAGIDVLAYDPSFDMSGAQAQSLLPQLRRAAAEGELRLYLQPKLALADTGVVGAEALLRWMHPQRGLLPPAEFIALAEQTGVVRDLTMWVFEEAARRWESLRGDGAPLRIAVNLSAGDLLDAGLPDRLDTVLARHHVPPQAFCLEVSERVLLDDASRVACALQRLAERGFKLSIDDYGTAGSSLGQLARLPVKELKIDRPFIVDLDRDARHAAVVRSAIHLAHELGLNVVAEGIESAAIWLKLREWGCDEGQGYHMSKPLPADELPAWCRHWREKQAPGLRARASLTT